MIDPITCEWCKKPKPSRDWHDCAPATAGRKRMDEVLEQIHRIGSGESMRVITEDDERRRSSMANYLRATGARVRRKEQPKDG